MILKEIISQRSYFPRNQSAARKLPTRLNARLHRHTVRIPRGGGGGGRQRRQGNSHPPQQSDIPLHILRSMYLFSPPFSSPRLFALRSLDSFSETEATPKNERTRERSYHPLRRAFRAEKTCFLFLSCSSSSSGRKGRYRVRRNGAV